MIEVFETANIGKVFWYIIVPLVIVLIIFYLLAFIFNLKYRDDNQNKANYLINFCSSLIGIVFGAILLGLSIGFSIAFIRQLKDYGLVATNQVAYYFFLIFPVFPFAFLIVSIKHFLTNLEKKRLIIKKGDDIRYGEE